MKLHNILITGVEEDTLNPINPLRWTARESYKYDIQIGLHGPYHPYNLGPTLNVWASRNGWWDVYQEWRDAGELVDARPRIELTRQTHEPTIEDVSIVRGTLEYRMQSRQREIVSKQRTAHAKSGKLNITKADVYLKSAHYGDIPKAELDEDTIDSAENTVLHDQWVQALYLWWDTGYDLSMVPRFNLINKDKPGSIDNIKIVNGSLTYPTVMYSSAHMARSSIFCQVGGAHKERTDLSDAYSLDYLYRQVLLAIGDRKRPSAHPLAHMEEDLIITLEEKY